MQRTALATSVLFTLLLSGCNDGDVVQGAATPSPTVEPTQTPTPQPTATPEMCQFYGIDAESNLWIIDPVAVTADMVGATGVSGMTDIAITPDNRIIGITFDDAWELDPDTGYATQIFNGAYLSQQNALDALPDGRLLVGGDTALIAVDIDTGASTDFGTMGGGRVFSGDAATISATRAFGTSKAFGTNDRLIYFDAYNDSSQDLGDLGAPQVFGLDYGCDGKLYGMIATFPPQLVQVDPNTANTTMLGTMQGGPSTLWGAAGPAEL